MPIEIRHTDRLRNLFPCVAYMKGSEENSKLTVLFLSNTTGIVIETIGTVWSDKVYDYIPNLKPLIDESAWTIVDHARVVIKT